MTELHVYAVGYTDGYEEVRFVLADTVAEPGVVAAFESDLRKAAMWFYPIGKIKSPPDERDGLCVATKPIMALLKAWEENGSPKVPGEGGGPSPFELLKDGDGDDDGDETEELD